ncbi:hypothetical protein BX666DRAFT_56506 [Dichotomocladium elegans]|nr:hypothetical protein BX666DRAFT_56506 [Dichotomocladium elegans]
MLQSSQILNVLPRRIVAGFWASQETRVSLSHLYKRNIDQDLPAASTPAFLCSELPVRYTHILRLLSTMSPDALQTPIIRNVAHGYLHDICTLLHPSLQNTSPRAFHKVAGRLHQRQAANLIRLRYALGASPTTASLALLDNINTIGFGIHVLLDQHLSWFTQNGNHVQAIRPLDIAQQAVEDARHALATALGGQQDVPNVAIHQKQMADDAEFHYIPNMLHRILFETTLVALRAQIMDNSNMRMPSCSSPTSWMDAFRHHRRRRRATTFPSSVNLHVFGGPTSVGFRLDTSSALLNHHDLHFSDVPRDPIGIPTCASLLHPSSSSSSPLSIPSGLAEYEALSGWRAAKVLASHFGGNLDVMSVPGIGASFYLALDRDTSLVERYPARQLVMADRLLRHHGRIAAAAMAATQSPLTIQAAQVQLDTFINAIAEQTEIDQQQQVEYNPQYHSVSLSAAVGHA